MAPPSTIVMFLSPKRRNYRFITILLYTFFRRGDTFFRCSETRLSARCGFFGVGYSLYIGVPETENCTQICAYFPLFQPQEYICGYCTAPPTQSPTIVPSPTSSPFEIYLDLDVLITDRELFRRARDTWTSIIQSDLPSVESVSLEKGMLTGNCRYPTTINDIYICCQYIDIDGEGGVVGRTAILATRNDTTALPVVSRIRLDNDDLVGLKDAGIFQQVVEHELAHALGFGILWGPRNLTRTVNGTCEYTGVKAIAEYRALTGCSRIPTTCGHWREECLNRELMTDSADLASALSRVTIASMADLGYDVSYDSAESFSRVDVSVSCLLQCPARSLMEVVVERTRYLGEALFRQRRHLSHKGYMNAVRHGLSVMKQESIVASNHLSSAAINVLYMENRVIFSVPVHRGLF
jgi:hypothetical protein